MELGISRGSGRERGGQDRTGVMKLVGWMACLPLMVQTACPLLKSGAGRR